MITIPYPTYLFRFIRWRRLLPIATAWLLTFLPLHASMNTYKLFIYNFYYQWNTKTKIYFLDFPLSPSANWLFLIDWFSKLSVQIEMLGWNIDGIELQERDLQFWHSDPVYKFNTVISKKFGDIFVV